VVEEDAVSKRKPRRPPSAASPVAAARPPAAEDDEPVPPLQLREERVRVETEPVEVGRVRIQKRITEWTETLQVPLRREDLVLEVLPGSGVVRIDGRDLQPGEVVELPLIQERATANKETVVSEDVHVRTVSTDVAEHIPVTLQREELVVEPEGAVELLASDDAVGPRNDRL
jgi:uncharacterized protein (TIGR02271 family)